MKRLCAVSAQAALAFWLSGFLICCASSSTTAAKVIALVMFDVAPQEGVARDDQAV